VSLSTALSKKTSADITPAVEKRFDTNRGKADMSTKRITVNVSQDVDLIRERLVADTGIRMSYIQIFNYLIHFYIKHAAEPRTRWASGETK
jgi:hypothetical protein